MVYKIEPEWQPDLAAVIRMPGLVNRNLNCYANSLMQTLMHTPSVFNHFLKYDCTCEKGCHYCSVKETFFNLDKLNKTGNKKPVPIEPVACLKKVMDGNNLGMKINDKNDPIEFLALLEEQMGKVDDESCSENFLEDIFVCKQEEISQCKACGSESRIKGFPYLGSGKGDVVDNLNKHFTVKDSGPEKFCDQCNKQTSWTERSVITSCPQVLVVKVREPIKLRKVIDISSYLRDKQDKAVLYELYSVIVYVGNRRTGDGHYYAYCKAPSGRWNVYNDTSVRKTELKFALKFASSLFYRRISEPDESLSCETESELNKQTTSVDKQKSSFGAGSKLKQTSSDTSKYLNDKEKNEIALNNLKG